MTRTLSISIVIIITAALLCACGGGGTRPSPVKQTAAQKPGAQTQTEKEKPAVQNITNQYYKTIAGYFSRKGYDAGHIYEIQDMIIPNDAEDAVTNLGKNWLSFLRNEIFARHGNNLNNDYLKETLGKTGWYKIDTNFDMVKSLNEKEKKNINFIIKLEKIDEEGPKEARQLAVLLRLPKEQLTTDEAIKVWKATKEKGVLTTIKIDEINNYNESINLLKRYNEIEKKGFIESTKPENIKLANEKIYLETKFIIDFNTNERFLIEKGENEILLECRLIETNIKWRATPHPGAEPVLIPEKGLANIKENGEIEFSNITNKHGFPKLIRNNENQDNIEPFYINMGYIMLNDSIIFKSVTDYITEYMNYKYKKLKNSLYVLLPIYIEKYTGFNEKLYQYASENKFLSGIKVFKITILN